MTGTGVNEGARGRVQPGQEEGGKVPFGGIVIYDVDDKGRLVKKETRQTQSVVPA